MGLELTLYTARDCIPPPPLPPSFHFMQIRRTAVRETNAYRNHGGPISRASLKPIEHYGHYGA